MSKVYETVIGLEVHVEVKQKFSVAAPPHSEGRQTAIPARYVPVCRVLFLF